MTPAALLHFGRQWWSVDHHTVTAVQPSDRAEPATWLGIDSGVSFFVPLAAGTVLPTGRSVATSIAFEIEPHLPLDAEAIALDFKSGDRPIVVAVSADPVGDLIKQLPHPAAVVGITPVALWLLHGWALQNPATDARIIWQRDDATDVCDIAGGRLANWKSFLGQNGLAQFGLFQALHPGRAATITIDHRDDPATFASLIQTAIRTPKSRRGDTWFNLRTGPLALQDPWHGAGRWARSVAVAATLLIAVSLIASTLRRQRVVAAQSTIRQHQIDAFAKTFPDARRTSAPMRLVRSRHAQSQAALATGATTRNRSGNRSGNHPPPPVAADHTLQHLLAAIPDQRFQIRRIDVVGDTVTMDLRLVDAADAYQIAESIAAGGFDVTPPATNQIDGGQFNASITATFNGGSGAIDGATKP